MKFVDFEIQRLIVLLDVRDFLNIIFPMGLSFAMKFDSYIVGFFLF